LVGMKVLNDVVTHFLDDDNFYIYIPNIFTLPNPL
jgi:hypothetical protein